MASDRQIAANRKNAKKSTGPVSNKGKQRSRQNAIRHGLATKIGLDDLVCADVKKIAEILSRDCGQASDGTGIAMNVLDAAQAQVDLLQIGKIRTGIHEAYHESAGSLDDIVALNESLRKLGRYERRAFLRRQRGLKQG
jgi:hypothetical protein